MERKLGLASFLFSSKAQYFDAIAKGAYSAGGSYGLVSRPRQNSSQCATYDWYCLSVLADQDCMMIDVTAPEMFLLRMLCRRLDMLSG